MEIRPLLHEEADYGPLVEQAGDLRFVLLGAATHGTHEFAKERAEITKRLIAEAGYSAVAVEGDWPDAYRVNRYVQGESADGNAERALSGFRRFPAWVWRNTDVLEFVEWLRRWNDALPAGARKVGFYGLDLYSLHASIEEVVRYLDEVDPEAADRARERYSCFDSFGRNAQLYAYETGVGGAETCEPQAVEQLVELRNRSAALAADLDDHFYAEQNAWLVVEAERYYRSMFRAGPEAWNIRERHMADTLDALVSFLDRTRGGRAKVAVWGHNSHVGDALATELSETGELNLGQLARQRHLRETLLVGFTTYSGRVAAAKDWGAPVRRRRLVPAVFGSWEEQFHEWRVRRFMLAPEGLGARRLERVVGVIYRPETERVSHYVEADLGEQFDWVLHFDETHAVDPLERTSRWDAAELPETYPWAV